MSELKCPQPERWVEVDRDCPACGASPVEIFTAEVDGNFWEGEEMRCTECGAVGVWTEGRLGEFVMELTTKWTIDTLRAENDALRTELTAAYLKIAEFEKNLPSEYLYSQTGLPRHIAKLEADNAKMREALRSLINKVSDNYEGCNAFVEACEVAGIDWEYDDDGEVAE